MTAHLDWRARLAERGFAGARQASCMHGAAVLRSWGEFPAAEAALSELLGRFPEDEGALRAMIRLLGETGRAEEAVPLRRRLHARRCRELGIPEERQDAAIAFLEAAETGSTLPSRAAETYVAALFDQYASHFDDKLRSELAYRAPEHVLAAVQEALGGRRELAVLDLGCGTGLAGVLLRPFARRLEGIDLSPGMLEQARARGVYDALHPGELHALLEASQGPYELIVAVDVLVYLGALEPLFERVARRLAPGGLFAFTVEKDTEPGYRLQPTGRYSHHLDYLRACARTVGLTPVVEREAVLRTERGQPVWGHVVVLRA
ncbi:class I SAM-dependent DNA methyltransferase [Hyalangium versicolor]|uniref:class I SAM-dependent DNA methyltransferase n=1 Tax=Hyalangium versicolor TaxID=2861190 RepID=UPI001CC9D1FB|nr:methyltransferase domain-containing protein [Hyalangium versicolor]